MIAADLAADFAADLAADLVGPSNNFCWVVIPCSYERALLVRLMLSHSIGEIQVLPIIFA